MKISFSALLALIWPAKQPAATVGVQTMSTATTIADVLAEAPDFIKLFQDAIAVEQAVTTSGVIAGLTTLIGFQADIVKVYNDILALGVSQAVAAGTVTVPAGA